MTSEDAHNFASNQDDENESLVGSLKKSLVSPGILIGDIFSGIVIGLINSVQIVPMAGLIFTGVLVAFVPLLVSVYLIGAIIGALLVASMSGYKVIISEPRVAHLPVFVAISVAISALMVGEPPETIATTIIATILLATFVIGVVLYFFGRVNLGSIARFVPLPVTAGILASMGVLVCLGAIEFGSVPGVSLTDPATFFGADNLLHLVPALAFGVSLYFGTKKFAHWSLPIVSPIIATAAFYLILYFVGIDIDEASRLGWFADYGDSTGTVLHISIFSYADFSSIVWTAVSSQVLTIISLVFLAVIGVMLELSAIELTVGKELDTSRELRANGISNMLNGLVGGIATIPAVTETALAKQLGGKTYFVIISYCVTIFLILFVGLKFLSLVPTFVFSGFVLISGLPLLDKWLFGQFQTLPKSEFFVILCIILGVLALGIIEGFVIGTLSAACLFVYSYSRLDSIKLALNRNEFFSSIDRSIEHQHVLDSVSERVQIFKLQGFLFFGSAHNALRKVRDKLDAHSSGEVRYVVLDFANVNSLDTSAVNSFSKLFHIAQKRNIFIVITSCDVEMRKRLSDGYKTLGLPEGTLKNFETLDDGVGWCDDHILSELSDPETDCEQTKTEFLVKLLEDQSVSEKIAGFMEVMELKKGCTLFHQGDVGDSLYFIVRGRISIVLESDYPPIKVRTMRQGAVLGEMTLWNDANRSASAAAEMDCQLYRLSVENYIEMKIQYPQETLVFMTLIVNIMSERISRVNQSILALSR